MSLGSTSPLLRLLRLGLALLTLTAIAYQFSKSHDNGFPTADFFSFFTIQTNLFAAAVFLYGAVRPQRAPSARRDWLRGASALYMAVVFVVFALLLAGHQKELQTTTPWVNTVVHEVMPVAVVFDWLIDPPRTALGLRAAAGWLVYPLAYLVYTLVRGPIADWYPYPFLDPAVDGYGGVAAHGLGILVVMVVFATAVTATGRARSS